MSQKVSRRNVLKGGATLASLAAMGLNVPAGEHTIESRATDTNGVVQPEETALADKKTMWENNGQFVRKLTL